MPVDPLGLYADTEEDTKQRQQEAEKISLAYRNLFNSPDGLVVMKDLANNSCFLGVCHVPGDPYSSAFNDGLRNLFLRILDLSGYTMEDLCQMKI